MGVENRNNKHRLFLIDVLRVICAICIYAWHSIGNYHCSYGRIMNGIFEYLTCPVLTCFFIISGFSIHYQHREEEISASWTKLYLKKRFIVLMPSYLLVVVIWPLVYSSQIENWVLLLPIDLLGIQTVYRSLFGILHNGGTWFVSCLFLCYVLYPVIKQIIYSTKPIIPMIILLISHFIMIYSSVIIPVFSLDSLYSNPIARSAEFLIGICFAELIFAGGNTTKSEGEKINRTSIRNKKKGIGGYCIAIAIILAFLISIIIAYLNHSDIRSLVFGYLVIPVILLLLVLSSFIRSSFFENSKVLAVLSGMSYQFFLMQLFLWDLTTLVLNLIHLQGNKAKILVSFSICTIGAYVWWRFFDKPIRKQLRKKFLK